MKNTPKFVCFLAWPEYSRFEEQFSRFEEPYSRFEEQFSGIEEQFSGIEEQYYGFEEACSSFPEYCSSFPENCSSIAENCSSIAEYCSSIAENIVGLKDDITGSTVSDREGWKRVFVGQNICDKDILQKNGSVCFFFSWNGAQNILLPPIGGRHRLLCFMTNPK